MVLLASQCWDEALLAAVSSKLLSELPDGALVLDYSAQLGEQPGRTPHLQVEHQQAPHQQAEHPLGGVGRPAESRARGFELVSTVRAPVSWDQGHAFWVWRVC